MANEISTAGITIKYCVETSAGTRPSTGYTLIPNVKDIPALGGTPDTLEVTDLSDTTFRRYIKGLIDPGSSISLTVNFTSAFKTAWETLVSAFNTAKASNKATWFEIVLGGGIGSFYFAGEPVALSFGGASVGSVLENNPSIIPNQVEGFNTSST